MNISPLEAQAFNYLSFGLLTLLNNLWTRLALSLWWIRTFRSGFLPPSDDPVSEPEPADPVPQDSDPDSTSVSAQACVPTVVGNGAVDVDGVTKGKFTLYYEEEIEKECESEETVTEEWEEIEGRREWWENWERLLRMKVGENENGWHTCQDLTALNGSVVRLWDGGFTRESFKHCRDSSSSCVVVW
ncbi:hypothetical protein VNO77_05478 [Canavalia gladiata]|uniref:Uncharacterized protein n=1 Tax=Canavalia gladiata TaxID=3824 RepID=A0AAN9N4Z5_CANGL